MSASSSTQKEPGLNDVCQNWIARAEKREANISATMSTSQACDDLVAKLKKAAPEGWFAKIKHWRHVRKSERKQMDATYDVGINMREYFKAGARALSEIAAKTVESGSDDAKALEAANRSIEEKQAYLEKYQQKHRESIDVVVEAGFIPTHDAYADQLRDANQRLETAEQSKRALEIGIISKAIETSGNQTLETAFDYIKKSGAGDLKKSLPDMPHHPHLTDFAGPM